MCYRYGLTIYQSRSKIHIVDSKKLLDEAEQKQEYKFIMTHYNSEYPLKIFDMEVSLLNKFNSLTNCPSTKMFTLNLEDKQIKKNIKLYHYSELVSDVKEDGIITNALDTVGFRSNMKYDTKQVDIPFYWELINNYSIDLTVKGVGELDIGTIVNVNTLIPWFSCI